ncbi:MAG: Specificity determinant for hsdM and hsdR [uncultured bacterium]|nr:MAG: Specificity determinant for hsdM and hsdR [uncultured bacterium]
MQNSQTEDSNIYDNVVYNFSSDWAGKQFESVLDTKLPKFKKYKRSSIKSAGKFPVIDQGEVFISGYIDEEEGLYKGELPIIIFGDHTRKIKYVDFPFAIGADGTKILKPKADLDSRFFYYYLKSILIPPSGYSRHYKYLREIEVPVPELDVQRQIVHKIDTQLPRIKALQGKINKAKLYLQKFRQSVLSAAVTGKLTEEWRESHSINSESLLERIHSLRHSTKNKLPMSIAETDLPDIPKTWQWISVDALANTVVDGVHKTPEYVDEGIPFITVRNLTAGHGISFESCKYISKKDHRAFTARAKPERGDLIITKDGTLGVVRAVRTDTEFSIFVSVAMIKPVLYEMSDYLEIALSSPPVQKQMVGVGSGLVHLVLRDLKSDGIPVPPFEEQQEITKKIKIMFDAADLIEKQIEIAEKRTDTLTQSILAKAFRGEL